MRKLFFVILACLILFTACRDTAERIGEDDTEDIETIKSRVGDQTELILKSDYDNITVSGDFRLSVPEVSELGIYDVICSEDFDNKSDKLFSEFIPEHDRSRIVKNTSENKLRQVIYDDENVYSFVTSAGGFVISDKKCLNKVLFGNNIPFLVTDLADSTASAEYEIGGVKTSMKELVSSSLGIISKFTDTADYPNRIVPFSFSTQKLEDGTVAGIMHCRSIYKGVPVFDLQALHDRHTGRIAELTPATCTFISGSTVGQFAVIHSFCDYKTVEPTGRIITPKKAVDLASEKLSGHMELLLRYEELAYFPTCSENRSGTENGNGVKPDDIIRLTPYWIIYFSTDWWHEVYATVNAVTGEADFTDNSK